MPVIWKWDRLEKEIDSGHPKSLIQNLFFLLVWSIDVLMFQLFSMICFSLIIYVPNV